jgi:uncharacterized protein GlcG (DUF336 family)
MPVVSNKLVLTADGARILIDAAAEHATKMGVPQCIAVVDHGCNLLAFLRMDGARILSIRSATRKAMTAATTGKPTGGLSHDVELKLAIATDGDMINLKGGMPIIIDGHVVGGIGVGSGTGDQDLEVANAALSRLQAAI